MRYYSKREILSIIFKSAKEYRDNLEGYCFCFIYKNKETTQVESLEAVFSSHNYLHLTGLLYHPSHEDASFRSPAERFYADCLDERISDKDIGLKNDGLTELKLEALPILSRFVSFTKMSANFEGGRPYLKCDRLVGNNNYSLGLTFGGKFLRPSSFMQEDIRNCSRIQHQVLVVFKKKRTEKTYRKVMYKAKGININNLKIPQNIEWDINN